ncbi:MAG: plasma-membrane proton-efflux P-type ATPase [Planctomycetota bacterium]
MESGTTQSVAELAPPAGLASGLSDAEVAAARARHGWNEVPERSEPAWRRVLRRLWGPIPWMIEVAALLSLLVRKWDDFAIISLLLLVNVVIDLRQEAKALSALAVLKRRLARTARVRRGGRWRELPARELVPGDTVKVRIGDQVPADLELAGEGFLQLDQSALTGESLPVPKGAGELAYSNAMVVQGEMLGQVAAIGLETYFGQTVALVARAEREQRSHFQRAVVQVGNFLIALALVLVALIVTVSLFRGDPALEILRFCLVLTVASIPVALPAVLSVTLAVGAVRLARRQAIVSRLVAIEELAGVDVLCSDKTGTLTRNRMTLDEPRPLGAASALDVLRSAALASRPEDADPLEAPVFAALEARGELEALAEAAVTRFVPFDPVHKRSEAEVELDGEAWVVTKGAPQVILALCDADELPAGAAELVAELARQGRRTLAVARRRADEERFHALGLLPYFDPPRDDSQETIARAQALGVRVQMLTGDNLAIARELARELGVGGEVHPAGDLARERPYEAEAIARAITSVLLEELRPEGAPGAREQVLERVVERIDAELSAVAPEAVGFLRRHESELVALIEAAGGFAEVLPADKYSIVSALQKADHIVAMTGDGVNDAPALRKADAGIAVSGATDAARAAADLVLLEPGLSVIVGALEEARRIFERMGSYAVFRIAETIRVILFMSLSIVVFDFYPVSAVMIVILALLNDLPIMAIAYDNARVAARPVRWDMREVLVVASVLGTAGVCASFLLFFLLEHQGVPRALIQPLIFLKLAVAGHSTIYVTRSRGRHFWERPFPAWQFLLPALGTQVGAVLIACYGLLMPAIGWGWAGWIVGYSLLWFVINDYLKVWTYRLLGREPAPAAARG